MLPLFLRDVLHKLLFVAMRFLAEKRSQLPQSIESIAGARRM
jgi:hypothetical protein